MNNIRNFLENTLSNLKIRSVLAAALISLGTASGAAFAADDAVDDIKRAIQQYPEIRYAMMGDVVFLHGSTEHIAELGTIIGKLMQIEGVAEVRSNITTN